MKSEKVHLMIWLLLLLPASPVLSQHSFRQYLDTTVMLIGAQQQLHIECTDTSSFAEGRLILDTTAWMEIIEETNFKTFQRGFIKDIRFTVFDSGYFRIPELGVVFMGDSFNRIGNPLYLFVNFPMDSLTQLRAIKNIEETKPIDRRWIYISLIILFLGLTLGILYLFFKADRISHPPQQLNNIEKIWESSLKALDSLELKNLWESGQKKSYVDELSFILRNFISVGIKIPALEHSTADTIEIIKRDQPKLDQGEKLSGFLKESDLIKFANADPDPASKQLWLDFVKNFIIEHAALSDQKCEEHRIHFKTLLGQSMAKQFESPEASVPDYLLRLPLDRREDKLILYSKLIRKHEFELPHSWVLWHKQGQGLFYKWQTNLLSISDLPWVQLAIFLIALPLISLFFPVLWLVAKLNKENLLNRGVFGLSASSKLLFKSDYRA